MQHAHHRRAVERVIHLCHTGALGSTMHLGQLATWDRLSADYEAAHAASGQSEA